MDLNKQKELFSDAYLLAVASVCGITATEPAVDDGIDWTLTAHLDGQLFRDPKLDVQLKCTSGNPPVGVSFPFELKVKNYNDLIKDRLHSPRILVVVVVPTDTLTDWLQHDPDWVQLRRCGYWVSLRGLPASANQRSVTIDVPTAQVFSPTAVADLMQRVADRGIV